MSMWYAMQVFNGMADSMAKIQKFSFSFFKFIMGNNGRFYRYIFHNKY